MSTVRSLALILALVLSPRAAAATFNVSTLADSGAGSLRQAIADANATAGADTITFSVSGTITLVSELVVSESLTINGPGARVLTVAGTGSRILRLDNASAKDVTITDMTFSGGAAAGNGGAILNEGGNLTLQHMRLVGNQATGEGGAIYNQFFGAGNILTIEDSELSLNSANKNGAIFFIGFQLRISNSTIQQNHANDSVGAILIQFGDAVIRNSTIHLNDAGFAVGGIQSQDSTLTLESTILAGNTDTTGVNDINRIGSGAVNATNSLFQEDVNATSVINGTNSGNLIGVDPQLGPLANNGGPTDSAQPGPASPAIGAGSNSQAYAFDQRGPGFPRDAGGAVDIGAVQAALPAPPPPPAGAVPVPALGIGPLAALSLLVLGMATALRRRGYGPN